MKSLRRFLFLLFVVVASAAKVTGSNFTLDTMPNLGEGELESDAEGLGFFGRFELALDQRLDETFADRLHPLKAMQWTTLHPTASIRWMQDRFDRAAGAAMTKSLEYGLRDAVTALPVVGWLQTSDSILGSVFADSVDSVEEESVSTGDISYRATERSWWRSLARDRGLRLGLRPLRTDPYAFLSARLREAGQTLMFANLRYYFRDFADHRFELATSFPLPGRMTLDLGTYYQFGKHDIERKVVMKAIKQIGENGIAHLGVEVRRVPVVFAGISFSF